MKALFDSMIKTIDRPIELPEIIEDDNSIKKVNIKVGKFGGSILGQLTQEDLEEEVNALIETQSNNDKLRIIVKKEEV